MSAIHILASGSKANAYIIEYENSMLLVDQGLSFREFSRRADMLGIDISRIKGILLTHEHEDHIKGVAYTAYKLDAPVFSTAKTLEILNESSTRQSHYSTANSISHHMRHGHPHRHPLHHSRRQ